MAESSGCRCSPGSSRTAPRITSTSRSGPTASWRWSPPVRIAPDEYLALTLRAHELLQGIPIHDVSAVDLPGGGNGRTLEDLRGLVSGIRRSRATAALFGLRKAMGRVLGWDGDEMPAGASLLGRLTPADRAASVRAPGTMDGAFRLLYQFERESLSEIRNATVLAYLSVALVPASGGYRLYFAVYTVPVSWISRPYLMAIEPFRRFIVYPALLGNVRKAWARNFSG